MGRLLTWCRRGDVCNSALELVHGVRITGAMGFDGNFGYQCGGVWPTWCSDSLASHIATLGRLLFEQKR